jgi:aspartokinase
MNTLTVAQIQETAFEKRRGIGRVEIRDGFAQVHVSQLAEPLMESRIAILTLVNDAKISLDFLKLTQSGMSFLVKEEYAPTIDQILVSDQWVQSVTKGQSIVMIHAANMRDEEGLIASVVSVAIASGVGIDHLGDMHDQILIVTSADGARKMAEVIKTQLMETQA